jgi:hypothetical protein
MKAFITGLGVLALICASPIVSASEEALLARIPADADAIVWINVGKIGASAELRALDSEACKGVRTKLGGFSAITGIDPLKDIDHFCFFAKSASTANESEVFGLQGRFDETRLTQLIALNEDYETTESGGHTIHQWMDGPGDGRCGVFLPDGIVMIAESLKALSAALTTAGDTKNPSRALTLRPADAEAAFAWAVFPKPEKIVPLNANWEAFHAQGVNAILASDAGTLKARANVFFDTDANAAEGLQIAEGVIAVGRLQDSLACLKTVARNAQASLGATHSVTIETSATAKEVVDKLAEQVCRH